LELPEDLYIATCLPIATVSPDYVEKQELLIKIYGAGGHIGRY
jgi:hypothetical protein